MRTGHVALGTAKPCCDIAKDLHLRGPPRILQQAVELLFVFHMYHIDSALRLACLGADFLFCLGDIAPLGGVTGTAEVVLDAIAEHAGFSLSVLCRILL